MPRWMARSASHGNAYAEGPSFTERRYRAAICHGARSAPSTVTLY